MNDNFDKEEIEIDLGALFRALIKKWWLFAICAVAGALLALIVTVAFITPKYQSQSMLFILSKTTTVTSLADIQIGSALTADFEVIAKSKPVIDLAIETIEKEEGKTFTRKEIEGMLSVSNRPDTRILVIAAISESPSDACIVANAVAKATSNQMAAIMKSDQPTTVETAEVSEKPISPSKAKNTLLGFLAGIVLVGLCLVIQFVMNDNIKTEEDIEHYLGLSTLAVVPYVKKKSNKKVEMKEAHKHEKKE